MERCRPHTTEVETEGEGRTAIPQQEGAGGLSLLQAQETMFLQKVLPR